MEIKIKKYFLLIIFLFIGCIFSGCSNNKTGEYYYDEEYDFSLNHPSSWRFLYVSGTKIFAKKPLDEKDVKNNWVNETNKDCILRFHVLSNSEEKSLDNFFGFHKDKIKKEIGENNFLIINFQDNVILYNTIDNKNRIFSITGSQDCKSENEQILSNLTLNKKNESKK